jgi:hypothetical protein
MMHAQPQLSATPPHNTWIGFVCLDPLEVGMIVMHLPRRLAIRRLLQVTAAKAAKKAKELNELPGAL